MKKTITLLAAAVGLGLAGGNAAAGEPEPFGRLSIEEVSQLLGKPGVVIYDDNAENVYAAGHLPGAKHLGVSEVRAETLPKDKTTELIFYCANPH